MKKTILIILGVLLGLIILAGIFGESSETSTDTEDVVDTQQSEGNGDTNTQAAETLAPEDSFTLGAYKGLPGMPATYLEIEAETDCQKLKGTFDRNEDHADRNRNLGKRKLAEIGVSYMEAAHERMEEIGCYDN